ncbi:nudix hydrolase 8-like isoform X2 [Cucurbita pepo subsp. pepo]|uniref:nudix hydrolase 8-like isoform X2 n=1 Tax=Cucurbita pepo subsp. pepo TaxID=3664 RepID=UPI000C9D4FEA|nr:nudix hydrolase 8-like isoform X2 [Cucurbita pepo subsp. pepo]
MGIIRYFRVVIFRRGFNYHHAEAGYAMLTFWIPDLSSMLSSDSSHHFGAAAFLINDNKEMDSMFLEMVAFRHCHLVAF